MSTEALYALFPDSRFVPDGNLSMHRSVAAFSGVVQNLRQEISVTDCKVYNILPRFLGHRHEFIMVVANVDGARHPNYLIVPNIFHAARYYTTGEEVQVIFQRMGSPKTDIEESTVTIHLGP